MPALCQHGGGPGDRQPVRRRPVRAPVAVEDLAAWLAIWEARREPDAHARRCASDAVDAIDGALARLHEVRQKLISEIRAADDATAARADALLRRGGDPPAR